MFHRVCHDSVEMRKLGQDDPAHRFPQSKPDVELLQGVTGVLKELKILGAQTSKSFKLKNMANRHR